ncbi:MAG: glycosyltransferase [Chloroflexi bacterium]|nr:glycosyltransferase [Chloroflexota bacterium]
MEDKTLQRIAFITLHSCPLARLGARDTGGMSVYVRRLAEGLGRLGFRVDIYTRAHNASEPQVVELDAGTRVIHIKAGHIAAPKERLVRHLPAFLSRLKAFQRRERLKYALVHSHYWLSGWAGNALAREWGVPHVTTFHTLAEIKSRAHIGAGEAWPRSATESQVVASVNRIVVSTAHEKGALQRLYNADAEKIRVVPGGVDLARFQPGDQRAARDRLGLNGHSTILYVGRLDPIKGLEVMMRTVAVMNAPRHIQLLVVGGGGDKDMEYVRMKRLACELAIQDRVEFLGSLSNDQLPTYYQAADVCVVPSYYESFGLVALEAMACGTPVVASRVPGLETIIQDNRSGYLVPWHCPDAFADRLEILLVNESLRRSIGVNGRERAAGMGWERTAVGVAGVYADLGVAPVRQSPIE